MTSRTPPDGRHPTGVLDTCTYIDLGEIDPERLPETPELTAITFAELNQSVALAKDDVIRSARAEKFTAAARDFDPLPFDGDAAFRYGSLVTLTLAAGRQLRPRRLDLMIAAIASAHDLPLYTRNPAGFGGLGPALTVVPV